jgi:O-succinylbenzoate synthase
MKELELKIAAFVANKNLKTRSGVPYEVKSFQRDGSGNVTALVGTVTETIRNQEGEEETVKTEMIWTPNGNAYCNKPMVFDLIEELPVSELGK